jgi:Protein of unknown function (DUF732)
MRPLLALLGVWAMLGLAAPAYGDPDNGTPDDATFLASLRSAGVTYENPAQAIAIGKSVCGQMGKGKSGPQLVSDLQLENPGLTTDHASVFIALAAKFYCPQQINQS